MADRIPAAQRQAELEQQSLAQVKAGYAKAGKENPSVVAGLTETGEPVAESQPEEPVPTEIIHHRKTATEKAATEKARPNAPLTGNFEAPAKDKEKPQ